MSDPGFLRMLADGYDTRGDKQFDQNLHQQANASWERAIELREKANEIEKLQSNGQK